MAERLVQQSQLSSRIARLRVERGLHQHELARAIGISTPSLKRWERADDVTRPLWWYTNAAIALDVDLDELIGSTRGEWFARPNAPVPPNHDFLDSRDEKALRWRAEEGLESPSDRRRLLGARRRGQEVGDIM
jgi:transcriptional regulator with XRE-family HTH domain